LVVHLLRLKEPLRAWEHAEADLARGLLDDLSPSAEPGAEDSAKLARVDGLNKALLPLLTREELTREELQERAALTQERADLLAQLARAVAKRTQDRILPLPDIQKQIPRDAALVFWLDLESLGQHLGCVLRSEGPPAWVPLRGSGKEEVWTVDD